MTASLSHITEAIRSPGGEELLRFMRDAYYRQEGVCADTELPPESVRMARDLGLMGANEGSALTDEGYLVGNVAKEYCNWVDHGRSMPAPRPPSSMVEGKDVLDLGCSFGRWLWEFQRTANSVVGVELQAEYVELGAALARCEGIKPPVIHQAFVEDLDRFVADRSIDLVFSRLVLNQVHLHRVLPKVAAVMRPGGVVWMQIETFRGAFHRIFEGEMRLRSRLRGAFGLCNSVGCMLTNRQMALPVRGRMHGSHRVAYPTLGWWRRTLERLGLTGFTIEHDDGGNAAISARKPC